jgi:hypothetical protein
MKTTARIQKEILSDQTKQMNAESSNPHYSVSTSRTEAAFIRTWESVKVLGQLNSSSTGTGKLALDSFPVRPKSDTASAPSLAGTMPNVVPNTVLEPRRMGFFASDVGPSQ